MATSEYAGRRVHQTGVRGKEMESSIHRRSRSTDTCWEYGCMTLPVLVLVGATATGKSRLAVEIALALEAEGVGVEIVNADSMLVYRGMDIGTAKPSLSERASIAHHLIDILDVTQRASVADFQELARRSIKDIRARGAIPIVVGGSALYIRAIVDTFEFPGSDAEVRARWEAELERVGALALHARLAELAPSSASKIEPANGRRTVRAFEVMELTGGHAPDLPEWTYELDNVHQFGLDQDRAVLDARINERVDAMWQEGLVEEVQHLLAEGLRDGVTAIRAIGYRQVVDFLDGNSSEEQAREETKKATRRFFRKQLGWYRRDPRITWLDAGARDNAERIMASLEWPVNRRGSQQ